MGGKKDEPNRHLSPDELSALQAQFEERNPATLIGEAIDSGDVDELRRILNAEPNWITHRLEHNRSYLHDVAEIGDADLVRVFCELGADPNCTSDSGLRPLWFAVQ